MPNLAELNENQKKPQIDYMMSTAYLLGTLELTIFHNKPLSIEDMRAAITTAKNQFKSESEVSNA